MPHGVDHLTIQTKAVKECFLCGYPGERKYAFLKDRLFDIPREWHLNQCLNSSCGLMWLDPCPVEEDVGKLYEDYVTHDASKIFIKGLIRNSILNFLRLLNIISLERYSRKHFYLLRTQPGRLLEVGCGDGHNLALLRKKGWEVIGQEIDPAAAHIAKTRYRCKVHVGTLQEISLPDNAFDVIITNHVLEHLSDPESICKECYRILKPGGKFVAITPNIKSLSHRYFQKDWVGLDVPRHLHLFSEATLESLIRKTGFRKCRCWTTAVNTALFCWLSYDIRDHVTHPMTHPRLRSGFKALIFKMVASAMLMRNKHCGEECVLFSEK